MVVIKRYSNRKLYNTDTKRYITLDGIAALIRSGHEVKVIDNETSEDLTAVTLTQIIFEQEKKQAGFLPRSVLTGLVQAGGYTLGTLRKSLALPLDMIKQVDEEIDRRIQLMAIRGEIAEEEAGRLRDKLSAFGRQPPGEVDEAYVESILVEKGVPTKIDLHVLVDKLNSLSDKLDEIMDESTS
ncbi:MAG: polyhydroxyalkanoate synthesis regulator DNA-binding domain-containing protein [Anaerolineales bacterium]|jgi:polyhydroxyalkanoate synthesis repressor PhaR|nr:polyhydroxyalkanoate synthesis regulator DNA-binding domain-containing protein [Anaerolineales bacterium]